MKQNSSSMDPRVKTVSVALAASCVAALTGWSAARKAAPPQPEPTPAVAVAAAVQTPEQILAAIPDAPAGTSAKKVDGEIAKWKAMAKREPAAALFWVKLGDSLMQKGRELVDPHYSDYAETAYQQALKVAPQNAEAMLGMSWVTSGRHQFDASVDWAKKVLAVTPNSQAAYGLIGDAQVEQGDFEGGFESYQKMLDIRPDIASYSRGAHLLFLTGDTRKAVWLMDKAVKSGGPYSENTLWCRAQLSEMLWSTGAILAAESVLLPGLKDHPNNYHLQTALGRVKEARKDNAGAIAAYEKAVSLSPQHTALVALGDLYLALGKKAEAEKQFERIEQAHAHHQTHGNHDEFYMARFYADHDRKIDIALKVVESREAQSPIDMDIAAWVYFKAGKQEKAREMINKALAKGAPDAPRLYHAGMIYAKGGHRAQAQRYLNNALSLNPHFNPVHRQIALATLRDLGSHKIASLAEKVK